MAQRVWLRAFSDVRSAVPLVAPPRVKGWPTPWLTQADIHSHLSPLKSFGWSIRFIPHTDDRATAGVLTNTFPLAAGSPDIAHKFVNDVYALTAAEKVA
jgi:hypothetical protein